MKIILQVDRLKNNKLKKRKIFKASGKLKKLTQIRGKIEQVSVHQYLFSAFIIFPTLTTYHMCFKCNKCSQIFSKFYFFNILFFIWKAELQRRRQTDLSPTGSLYTWPLPSGQNRVNTKPGSRSVLLLSCECRRLRAFLGHYQGARSEVEMPGLEPVPIWVAGTADRGLA